MTESYACKFLAEHIIQHADAHVQHVIGGLQPMTTKLTTNFVCPLTGTLT